jgi:UDP-N-acetylglucosamine 2-epimerase (non-hydrolysing)
MFQRGIEVFLLALSAASGRVARIMSKIALLAGARPNYMKVFPIWREIRRSWDGCTPVLIHTGQHYDPLLSDVFFKDFGIPAPDHFLGVGSGSHGVQTGKVMIALEELLMKERPDALVVVGDVNSTVAGALVGVKLGIPVAHVEAGLRSRDRSMPEEINRMATDAICDLLLTPSRDADENLRNEGVPAERIRFVGNVMRDSLVEVLPRAKESQVLDVLGLNSGAYTLITLHRPSNVDEPESLRRILADLKQLAKEMPVVFPVHPRTRNRMNAIGACDESDGIRLVEPLGYIDFLRLQSDAALVVTDSGGVQEETSFLGVRCLTLRPNTERPITITHGTNVLVRPGIDELLETAEASLARSVAPAMIEYWDGRAAGRIVEALRQKLGR